MPVTPGAREFRAGGSRVVAMLAQRLGPRDGPRGPNERGRGRSSAITI